MKLRPQIGAALALPLLASALWLRASAQAPTVEAPVVPAQAQVYFSPKGGAQAAIVRAIGKATKSADVQAYSFTSAPIAKALIDAQKRGVVVRAILDKGQRTARYTGATFLKNSGAVVLIDARHAIAHSKIMVLDAGTPAATIITGSFNFTKAAEESNAENLLVLRECPDLVAAYVGNWEAHAAHAVPYERDAKAAAKDAAE